MSSERQPKIVKIPDGPLTWPPVTRQVALPPIVSVKYLAEVCGVSPEAMSVEIGYRADRSVNFQIAAGILRRRGIEATITTA